MKRIISFLLAMVVVSSVAVTGTGATGTLLFYDDFNSGFISTNWITDPSGCAYKWDSEGYIYGYDAALVLQSNFDDRYVRKWDKFYASFDFQIRAFDDTPDQVGRTHSISMWYRDLFESSSQGAVYLYTVVIETGEATLTKQHSWSYYDNRGVKQNVSVDKVIASGKIPVSILTGETAPWYEIGMRVTSGKIECYLDEQLVITAKSNSSDTKYGSFTKNSVDASVGSQKSGILFFNRGNYIVLDNFKVWSSDYDFNAVIYGDTNGDDVVNVNDVMLVLRHIAEWNNLTFNKTLADVNCDGNINLLDAIRMMQFIAKWNITLGP